MVGGNRHDSDIEIGAQPLRKKIGSADARVAYHDHLGQNVIFKMPFHGYHKVDEDYRDVIPGVGIAGGGLHVGR